MKAIVVYESKYGNTRRVAETILEGMNMSGGVEASLIELKEIDIDEVSNYDVVLIGSPNHWGGPTRGIKNFIKVLSKLQPGSKWFVVFDTYMGKDFGKAVKKMEKQINEELPRFKRMAPGLSIEVRAVKGPVVEGELQKCREFGETIAALLKQD